MNNEQQELLDDAYENYKSKINLQNNWEITLRVGGVDTIGQQELLSQEEFISKIKTDSEFSQMWGLKIEEQTILEQVDQNNPMLKGSTALYPRKLIIVTYNEKTIESYE
jgi:hypothetical protein